jgi:hypothetical protein
MERAARRSQLQTASGVRSSPPCGASPIVAKRCLSRAYRAAFFCLVQFGLLIAGSQAIAADRLDTKQLVEMANRYQVAMPPKEARLVFASLGGWVRVSDGLSLHPYSPAFLLEERPDGSVVILRGLKREVVVHRDPEDPTPIKPFSAKDIDPQKDQFLADFNDRPALVTAVQLAARGEDTTAQLLWQQVATTKKWTSEYRRMRGMHTEDDVPDAKDEIANPPLILAECIFDDLESRLTQKDADWQTIDKRMQALVKEVPELSKGRRKTLFEDLGTTLKARPPAPGSIEARLLAWSRQPYDLPTFDLFERGCKPDPQRDAPACEIVVQGFDAIPPLLALLRDNRLTAHRENPEAGDGLLRVRHLAAYLLSEMTGVPDCLHGCDRGERDAAAQRDWWEHARLRKEVDVFSEAIFERQNGFITSDRACPARILAAKYPSALPALLKKFLKTTSGRCPWHLAQALAESALPKVTRIRVLSEAAGQGSTENRRCLLQTLAELDSRAAAELLLPLLKKLPHGSDGAYWTDLRVIMDLADDEVWHEFQRAAQRASIGLRLEMISTGCSCGIPEKNRARASAFFAAFLDDAGVRLASSGGKPCAGLDEVRNVAAKELAYLLDLDEKPQDSWTDDQWRAFREKVRKRVAAEKVPTPPPNK